MGHIAKDCRLKQENNVYKKETYENKSQKYKNKTVPVCKTISDSILSILGFIYESNVQVKTATDDVKKVLGETEEGNVDIEGHT
ncbi:unnamed protein product [Brachionus calyciflorus]|uniref:Uncharacterized protein n=1 Tax=Brachionus calyciflorus TaxID=104777 RepID=A0A814SFR4_9BILA|nr:unnamed protein product [Brachionus calyciflorus]